MDIAISSGVYVIAVSGGLDSMVLLDVLQRRSNLRLVVAHLDHGIRPESAMDRQFVQGYAQTHGLPFVYHEARLGPDASEDEARQARYEFLHKVRLAAGADAILTAHHQDDQLETAVHNVLRGTGRKGLASLQSGRLIKRPLLSATKAQLKAYAKANQLVWREDSSNQDLKYRRNVIRHQLLTKADPLTKRQFLARLVETQSLSNEIDQVLEAHLQRQPAVNEINRQWFIMLPHAVAREMMAAWLRRNGIGQFDRKLIERLVRAAKTYRPAKVASVKGRMKLHVSQANLALKDTDR